MPVVKHEKFIEPPGFEHISHLAPALSAAERPALVATSAPESVEQPATDEPTTPRRGTKSQED